jgi:hypothetical protein
MPTGFQQDTNQLSPDFYRVVITMNGGTATWTAASPANGAVNPFNWDSYATLPSSDANAQRLARGNMRFQAIIEELSKYADAQIIDVEVTSAGTTDANNVPTALAFTVRYDRDDFVLPAVLQDATSFTPTTGGAVTIDTTAKALRYLVVQGIQRGGTTGYSRKWNTWSFTNQSGQVEQITIQRPDTNGDIYDDVAVSLLDGTELTSTV